MIQYLTVFALGFIIDIFYVGYISAVTQRAKLKAGVMSILLAAPALFGYIEISGNPRLCVPYFLGLFLGTIVAMELKERADR
jgi:hypothetical protein